METWYWLIILAVFLIIEIATLGLATIWFAVGAVVAYAASLLGAPLLLQIAYFFVVSFVLLFFTRPLALRYFNKDRAKTNIDSIIGTEGLVTETIDNLNQKGHVSLEGKEWTARSEHNQIIEKGTKVRALSISGVKLIVTDNIEE